MHCENRIKLLKVESVVISVISVISLISLIFLTIRIGPNRKYLLILSFLLSMVETKWAGVMFYLPLVLKCVHETLRFLKKPDFLLVDEEDIAERQHQLQEYLNSILQCHAYRNMPETVSIRSFILHKYCCLYSIYSIFIRNRPRFLVQVWHENSDACIGKKHFFH